TPLHSTRNLTRVGSGGPVVGLTESARSAFALEPENVENAYKLQVTGHTTYIDRDSGSG
ncbi:hypothetical protein H0H93_009439, partial [Arthromyces matolae]